MRDTAESAREFVIDMVESKGSATRDDFDIAAIVDAYHDRCGDWRIDLMNTVQFWGVAAAHLR